MTKEKERDRRVLAMCVDLLLLGLEICVNLGAVLGKPDSLQFYTVDSNLLAMAAAGVGAVCLLRELSGRGKAPGWAALLKFASAACLLLTFLVVACVLAPMYGGAAGYRAMMLSGDGLYHHLICPVLTVGSFLLLDDAPPLGLRAATVALIPTALYAAVTVVLNLTGMMRGPYPFLRVYEQPVWASALWLVGIVGGAYLLARLLLALNRRVNARRARAAA